MAEQLRLTPGEVNKVLAAAVETNRDDIDVSRLIADAATAKAVRWCVLQLKAETVKHEDGFARSVLRDTAASIETAARAEGVEVPHE